MRLGFSSDEFSGDDASERGSRLSRAFATRQLERAGDFERRIFRRRRERISSQPDNLERAGISSDDFFQTTTRADAAPSVASRSDKLERAEDFQRRIFTRRRERISSQPDKRERAGISSDQFSRRRRKRTRLRLSRRDPTNSNAPGIFERRIFRRRRERISSQPDKRERAGISSDEFSRRRRERTRLRLSRRDPTNSNAPRIFQRRIL
jgi:hypothetical protein